VPLPRLYAVRLTRSLFSPERSGHKHWRAPLDRRAIIDAALALAALGVAIWCAITLLDALGGAPDEWPISLELFVRFAGGIAGLAAAYLLMSRALRQFSLFYELDRNAIVVHQRGFTYTIPLDRIEDVTPVEQRLPSLAQARHQFGRGRPVETLLIDTTTSRYRLALAARDRFLRELEQRRRIGTTRSLSEGATHTRPESVAFWSARSIRWLLALNLALALLVWTILTSRYPALPDTIPLRFDPIGGTAGIRPRIDTLLLPSIGTAMTLANALLARFSFRRSRLAAELLLTGALMIQLLLIIAVWLIVAVAE
jgi:hypothetical protein